MDNQRGTPERLSRRRFLALSGAASLAALLSACGSGVATPTTATSSATTSQATSTSATSAASTTTAAGGAQTSSAASTTGSATSKATTAAATSAASAATPAGAAIPKDFKDAPALADLVKAGKLPAVKDRLPEHPIVITPVEKVGQYGGNWRAALVGGQDTAWLTRTIGYENLVRWDPEWKQVIPNVAERFEANADATQFTFWLRKGMKWSDGEPFTVDDIVFYDQDIYHNKELTTSLGTNPHTVKKLDDVSFTITFEKPNGLFLKNLATPDGDDWTRYPAHYLKQFHKQYADAAKLDQLMKDNKAETWVKLFQLKGMGVPGTPYNALWSNPDLPTIFGWVLTTPYGEGTRVVAERNPFYWKVDTSGNQLPYIDKVSYDVLQDKEVLLLKASNGEIDMQDRNLTSNQNKPVLTDNQQKSQYHFFETVPSGMNNLSIALNLTHKDPVKKQIFQNKDFRIGLSYAIDRKRIIDTVYVGQGEPWQLAPRKESEFYNETLAKQYTEHDVAKANAALDKAFPKKDGDGMRLGPDGKPINFIIEVTSDQTERVDAMKLVAEDWKKVGVQAQIKNEDRSLLYSRKRANEHDCAIWGGDGGYTDAILECRWYFPFSEESNYAEAWYVWYKKPSNPGTPPEEPPAAAKKQMDLYDNVVQGSGDEAKQAAAFKQILQIAQEEFYAIGICLGTNGYGLVKNNFHNVPQSMPGSWLYPNPAPTNTVQYFFSK
jgi:peptide/nickel transport system substrate-binding protein